MADQQQQITIDVGNSGGYTIVCDETGKEFDTMEAYNEHREELLHDKTINAVEETLVELFNETAEDTTRAFSISFEEIVEAAIEDSELSVEMAPENAQQIAGLVRQYTGKRVFSNTHK